MDNSEIFKCSLTSKPNFFRKKGYFIDASGCNRNNEEGE